MRLKKVTRKENDLVISNFRKVVEVPLQDVERVSGSVLIHPELVWLHFRRPNGFGSKVVFFTGKARFSVWPLSSPNSSGITGSHWKSKPILRPFDGMTLTCPLLPTPAYAERCRPSGRPGPDLDCGQPHPPPWNPYFSFLIAAPTLPRGKCAMTVVHFIYMHYLLVLDRHDDVSCTDGGDRTEGVREALPCSSGGVIISRAD